MIRPEDLHLIGVSRSRLARSPYQRAVSRRRRERAIAWCGFLLLIAAVLAVRVSWR